MTFIKSEFVKLNSEMVLDICKEVTAFANAKGRTMHIGVSDDGDIIGVENANRVTLQLNYMLRDFVKADVTMFVGSMF